MVVSRSALGGVGLVVGDAVLPVVVQNQVHGDVVGRLKRAAGHGTHSHKDPDSSPTNIHAACSVRTWLDEHGLDEHEINDCARTDATGGCHVETYIRREAPRTRSSVATRYNVAVPSSAPTAPARAGQDPEIAHLHAMSPAPQCCRQE
jgi:hypothetical protein